MKLYQERGYPILCRLASGVALLLLTAAPPAAAQSLDRDALEELFGEPVTTSATGKPQRASEVPAAMNIITAAQIRQSGANDIPGVLARFTSLDVQQYGPADYSVTARGYGAPNTQRLLVLVNGRQVYLDALGRTSWDNIPVQLSEIRQIEVVRGPNSALFGFNAVAGAINIVTYDPAHDRINSAVVRGGAGGYREVSGVTTAPLGEGSGLRLSAGLRNQEAWRRGYQSFEREFGGDRDLSHAQVAADASIRLSNTVQAGFDASYSRSIGGELQLPGLLLPWDIKTWSLRGRITAETTAGTLEASIYYNRLESNLLGTPLLQQGVTVVQLNDTVKLGAAHTVRPFLEYRHNAVEAVGGNDNGASLISTSLLRGLTAGLDIVAVGGMWNWAITPNVEWTSALRHDQVQLSASGYNNPRFPFRDSDYDRNYSASSWNAGLVWRATEVDTLRISAARGVGIPSYFDIGTRTVAPALGLATVGSPLLKPATVDNYEVGYGRQVEEIDGRVGATVFYQANRGISSSLGGYPSGLLSATLPTIIPYNLDPSHAYGAEVSANGRLRQDFDWGVEYRFVMVEEGERRSYADFAHASPRHLVSARLGWGQGPLRADLFSRYSTTASGYRVTERGVVPVEVADYASLAARLGYKVTEQATVSLEGSSLLHERQRQSIGAEAERRVYLSLRVDF